MTFNLRSVLHGVLRYFGVDVIRWYKAPESTLLGLTEYDIRTVLDIGANIGQSARFYRQTFPKARIYSFEPLPAVYESLDAWAQRQNSKAKALNIALGGPYGSNGNQVACRFFSLLIFFEKHTL